MTAHVHVAAAGAVAARTAEAPGSFAVAFLDALHTVSEDDLTAVDVTVETVERTHR